MSASPYLLRDTRLCLGTWQSFEQAGNYSWGAPWVSLLICMESLHKGLLLGMANDVETMCHGAP